MLGLKRSEQSLLKAQEIARLGNWDWHITENKVYWSDEIYRIFGLKKENFQATYEAFLKRVHPDDIEYVKSTVRDAISYNKTFNIDHRIILPSGEVRYINGQADLVFESGKAIRMIGSCQDIIERPLSRHQRLGFPSPKIFIQFNGILLFYFCHFLHFFTKTHIYSKNV
jgi:PAS domain-containing protein